MIRLGEVQTLQIVKKVEFGVYLGEEADAEERVLLPKKQVPEQARVGDGIEVFIYRDSKDRLIATVHVPKLTLHSVARVRVAQVGKVGAFLDWGLEKELLLPFKEQTRRVSAGEECLVALYIDKSNRLCATMNVYPYLLVDSPYQKEDRVRGTVYEISRNFGAFVAVDDKYSGLIPQKELYGAVQVGDVIEVRVTAVKEDGKLNLSIREKAYLQIEKDAQQRDRSHSLPINSAREWDLTAGTQCTVYNPMSMLEPTFGFTDNSMAALSIMPVIWSPMEET